MHSSVWQTPTLREISKDASKGNDPARSLPTKRYNVRTNEFLNHCQRAFTCSQKANQVKRRLSHRPEAIETNKTQPEKTIEWLA